MDIDTQAMAEAAGQRLIRRPMPASGRAQARARRERQAAALTRLFGLLEERLELDAMWTTETGQRQDAAAAELAANHDELMDAWTALRALALDKA